MRNLYKNIHFLLTTVVFMFKIYSNDIILNNFELLYNYLYCVEFKLLCYVVCCTKSESN